jgi:hypothetical protein
MLFLIMDPRHNCRTGNTSGAYTTDRELFKSHGRVRRIMMTLPSTLQEYQSKSLVLEGLKDYVSRGASELLLPDHSLRQYLNKNRPLDLA